MIRILARTALVLLSNALGLFVASLVLEDVTIDGFAFVIAVGLFTLTAILFEPLLRQTALKNAPALLGSSALVSTLVSLIVTALVSDGLHISGLTTWILAAVIVWAVSLAGQLLLPLVIFKKILANRSDR